MINWNLCLSLLLSSVIKFLHFLFTIFFFFSLYSSSLLYRWTWYLTTLFFLLSHQILDYYAPARCLPTISAPLTGPARRKPVWWRAPGDEVARIPTQAAVGGTRSQLKYISTSFTCYNYFEQYHNFQVSTVSILSTYFNRFHLIS